MQDSNGTYNGFIDLDESPNLEDGLEYKAAGVITAYYEPNPAGKDYEVSYINPWGKSVHAWRAVGEIRLQPMARGDFHTLYDAINSRG
jgi:hypothetical protein